MQECSWELTQRLVDSLFSLAVRTPLQDVEIARRIFVKIHEVKLKPQGRDLWCYMVLLARNGDVVGCSMAWAHTGACGGLDGRRAAVEQKLQAGLPLPQA